MSYVFQVIATDIDGYETVVVQCWDGTPESAMWNGVVDRANETEEGRGTLRCRVAYDLASFDELNEHSSALSKAPQQGYLSKNYEELYELLEKIWLNATSHGTKEPFASQSKAAMEILRRISTRPEGLSGGMNCCLTCERCHNYFQD